VFLTEQEIRSILKFLNAHNIVKIKRGRAGTTIFIRRSVASRDDDKKTFR